MSLDDAVKEKFGADIDTIEKAEKLWKDAYQAAKKFANESGRTDAASDTMSGIKYDLKEGGLYGQEGKTEDRQSFLGRVHEGTRKNGEVGGVAYAYVEVGAYDTSFAAEGAAKELNALGIKNFFHAGLEYNDGGKTYVDDGRSATIGSKIVGISSKATGNGKEIAGHEAFHVWQEGDGRAAYLETVRDNLNTLSVPYLKMANDIADRYFKNTEINKGLFQEEIFATISGQIHSGEYDAELSTMFKDYGAVKAAWNELVRQNTKNDTRLSLKDSTGKALTKEQAEFFKDSKAMDEDGNLLVVYHGAKVAGFNTFQYDKARQTGDNYGEAYYFTTNLKNAKGYAKDNRKDARLTQYEAAKDALRKRALSDCR